MLTLMNLIWGIPDKSILPDKIYVIFGYSFPVHHTAKPSPLAPLPEVEGRKTIGAYNSLSPSGREVASESETERRQEKLIYTRN